MRRKAPRRLTVAYQRASALSPRRGRVARVNSGEQCGVKRLATSTTRRINNGRSAATPCGYARRCDKTRRITRRGALA